jgi:hypothetical protein
MQVSAQRRTTLDRSAVVLARLGERVAARRLARGARQELDGLRIVAGLHVVARELFDVLVDAVGVEALEGLGHASVDRRAPLVQQRLVGHLLGGRVFEAVAGLTRELHRLQQLEALQLIEAFREVRVGSLHLGQPHEHPRGNLASHHRGEPQEVPRRRLEPIDPAADDGLHRLGQRELVGGAAQLDASALAPQRALLRQRRADLLDEERIAAGPLVDALRELVRRMAGAETMRHQLAGRGPRHRLEPHDLRLERAPPERVVRAVVDDDQDPVLGDLAREADQGRLGRLVGPMPVLEVQQHGALQRKPLIHRDHRLLDRLRQRLLLHLRWNRELLGADRQKVEVDGQVALERRVELADDAHHPLRDPIPGVVLAYADAVAEGLQKGQVGRHTAVGLTTPVKHEGLVRVDAGAKLVDQPALADPRLADDRDHVTVSRAGVGVRGAQAIELVAAARERRQASRERRLEARADTLRVPDAEGVVVIVAEGLELEEGGDTRCGLAADQDLVVPGVGEERPCRVEAVARDGVEAIARVARLGHDEPRLDDGMELDRRADAIRITRREREHGFAHLESGGHGAPRVVVLAGRNTEDRRHLIADELVHHAPVRLDDVRRALLDLIEDLGDLLGIEGLVHRGVAGEVGEQHGGGVPLAFGLGRRRLGSLCGRCRQPRAALDAEGGIGRRLIAALRAGHPREPWASTRAAAR